FGRMKPFVGGATPSAPGRGTVTTGAGVVVGLVGASCGASWVATRRPSGRDSFVAIAGADVRTACCTYGVLRDPESGAGRGRLNRTGTMPTPTASGIAARLSRRPTARSA